MMCCEELEKIMKVFVWHSVRKCSDRYHSEGGVVVFAEDEEAARKLANQVEGCEIEIDEKPDEIRDVAGGEAIAYVMPDAGCC